MRRISTLMIVACMMALFYPATAQRLPNDRESDGLRGRVHIVEESDISTRPITDTVHRKSTYDVIVKDTHRVFLFFKKVETKKVKRDTVLVEQIIKQVPDTHYYSRTEYTPEGYLKSRIVVQDGQSGHEQTVTTFFNNRKIEMRNYCKETDVTTQWHYFYSDYGKEAQLEQIVVTQFRGHESGVMIERVEYEYITESETCRERHVSPSGETLKALKYESGVLTDMACGRDTNMHYIYDADGRLTEIEVYNADFDLVCTDKYENSPTGVILTRKQINRRYGRQPQPEVITYIEEYDGIGNWTRRTANGKEQRSRVITYYGK